VALEPALRERRRRVRPDQLPGTRARAGDGHRRGELYTYEPNDQSPAEAFDFRTLHGYTGEVRHFVECVRDGRVPAPGIEDGIAHLKLELAAKRSALEDRPVAVAEIG
jgi:predicted dehydrogenase